VTDIAANGAPEANASGEDSPDRESMAFDVVIVGAGPAGLAAAIRLKQRAAEAGAEISVAVLEKGSEVGAHILSGAVIDPVGLDALVPDWRTKWDLPQAVKVSHDRYLLLTEKGGLTLPNFIMPRLMSNHGAWVASLGDICRQMAAEAESLGVEIYPGFAAADYVIEDGVVKGVVTNDLGVNKAGERTESYQPGMALLGKYTLLAEGARGNLSKRLIAHYGLADGSDHQKYGIGLKEIWQVAPENHKPGLIQHSFGWPLKNDTGGGSFIYHFAPEQLLVSVGFVVHLNYANPFLDPYREVQRFKHHPDIAPLFAGAKRIAYGARAISEGGYQSVPKLVFPGGALVGDSAGFVNVPRIKGSHNAVQTGMMAADAAFEALSAGRAGDALDAYQAAYEQSAVAKDLRRVRNVKPLWSRFGLWGGVLLGGFDMWTNSLFGFSVFGTLRHGGTDAESTGRAKDHAPIEYPKPDGVISFDRLSSVFISNTNHAEDQPVHLKLRDPAYPLERELPVYGGPSTRYCPAGVYEYVDAPGGGQRFQINAQNCVHCKTCDIKDPEQNIIWTPPEGGGGPNYPNM
jgi:electron-transferring-flavoprotein dehydrogenase